MPYDAEVTAATKIAAALGDSGILSVLSGEFCLGYTFLAEVVVGVSHTILIKKSGLSTEIKWEPTVGKPGTQYWCQHLRQSDTVTCTFVIIPKKKNFLSRAWQAFKAKS